MISDGFDRKIPILILAAGAASRMRGIDKLTQMVGGQPLLRVVASRAADVGDVFVALYHNAPSRLAVMDGLPITPLLIPEAAGGLSGTMRGAIPQLPACDAFMVLLADLPDITTDDMRRVIAARAEQPDALIWRGATADQKPGHPILFDASLRPEFSKLSGDSGGEDIVKRQKDRTVMVPLDGDRARCDLDTPEAWAAWRARRANQ